VSTSRCHPARQARQLNCLSQDPLLMGLSMHWQAWKCVEAGLFCTLPQLLLVIVIRKSGGAPPLKFPTACAAMQPQPRHTVPLNYLGQLKPLRRDARSPAFRRWPVPARRHAVLSMFCACLSPSGIFGPPPQPFSVFPACPVHNHLGGKEMCSEQPTQWLRCVLATSRRPAGPSR